MDSGLLKAASELHHVSDVIDLHIDSFIWKRILGYNFLSHHHEGRRFYQQVDLPRLKSGGFTGAIWSITTNPFRSAKGRETCLRNNLISIQKALCSQSQWVSSYSDYIEAKKNKQFASWVGIQGGNALSGRIEALDELGKNFIKITLVHLLNSDLGCTSSPFKINDKGLSQKGHQYVQKMVENKILVDLAHINQKGFWEVIDTMPQEIPVISSHTGVSGVYPHWRNLDDDQLKAIATTGGTVGIIYEKSFLGKLGTLEDIYLHMNHTINVIGEDFVSLGSDWDGLISPPKELLGCDQITYLTAYLIQKGWSDTRIRKILGGNFLRVLKQIRP